MTSPNDKSTESVQKPIAYGNPVIGVWRCLKCGYDCFPRHLRETEARPPFRCPECGKWLVYDEED